MEESSFIKCSRDPGSHSEKNPAIDSQRDCTRCIAQWQLFEDLEYISSISYYDINNSNLCQKGKNIWKGPRPEGWPASIPFQDPNRTSKDDTKRAFILNKRTMVESYTFDDDFKH